jgi:hypothetical protein
LAVLRQQLQPDTPAATPPVRCPYLDCPHTPTHIPACNPSVTPPCRAALPQPSDSDWDKPKPRHPIVGPASYPKSQPDVISAPGLFRKMDPEALFFAFYYQPDTYQQYLAAQVRVCAVCCDGLLVACAFVCHQGGFTRYLPRG